MRVFLAGATGVLGVRLVPLLIAAGHTVGGMTPSSAKAAGLEAQGAEPIVCDVYDQQALTAAVLAFAPDAVMHQLTDLPDRAEDIAAYAARNDRIRTEGTANLVTAFHAAEATCLLVQSIAWRSPGREAIIDAHEQAALDAGGIVIRYGQLYGPDTFYVNDSPPPPRVQIDAAARRTVPLLDAEPGVYELTDS